MPRVGDIRLDKRRLEQARVELSHHLRCADRRQIGSALVAAPGAERVAEREQQRGSEEHGTNDPQHQH
jgi:hypothetical protein